MEQPTATLAANIRAEMGRRQVSQKALADAIGITQSGVSKRLNEQIPWTFDELARIAQHLGVPLTSLLDGVAA